MIAVLEGPDGVGKTTLFNKLRSRMADEANIVWVPSYAGHWADENAPLVEYHKAELFAHVYDRRMLYVWDRSPWTTSPVYDKLNCRKTLLRYELWLHSIRVLYLRTSYHDVKVHTEAAGETFDVDRHTHLEQLYMEHLQRFNVTFLPMSEVADSVLLPMVEQHLRRWQPVLTEEQLQALCHSCNKNPLSFAEGCVEFNRKLFGDKSLLEVKPCS